MRHAILVVGIAGGIVAAWVGMSSGLKTTPGSLPPLGDDRGRVADLPAVPLSVRPASDAAVYRIPGPLRTVSKATGLTGMFEETGPVGAAVHSILERTAGQEARLLDRSFAKDDISRILEAWRKDPLRKSADVDFFVKVWDLVEDPTTRYALSFLFRHVRDDRLIRPLTELAEHHPWQAIDGIAAQNSNAAFAAIADLADTLDDPQVRAHATTRIATGGWEGARDHLLRTVNDHGRSDEERMVAVECLGRLPADRESRLEAFRLALGPPKPLTDLGERSLQHPVADLRSGAVMAVMASGDSQLTRRLLDAADSPDANPALLLMVDTHICGYAGSDISQVIFDRANRRKTVSRGELLYLNRTCTKDDVEALRRLVDITPPGELRQLLLEGVLPNASTRP